MASRLELHEILCEILGTRNVYFQPPESIKLKYPAIIYSRTNVDKKPANNSAYLQNKAYQLIVIDKNPDSELPDKILKLPLTRFNNHYVSDSLNHDVFTIFY